MKDQEVAAAEPNPDLYLLGVGEARMRPRTGIP